MLTPESQPDSPNQDDPIEVAVAAVNALCGRQIEARIAARDEPISREIASQMLLLLGLAHLADEQQGVPELQWKDLVMHAALNAIVGRSGPVAAGLDSYWHARTVRERDRRNALEDENRHLRARICVLESTCDADQAA